jgi:type II secretory pathway pseudopilin PulG
MRSRSIATSLGFTVIEILLVVVIMAISAAIVVPMVGNRDDVVLAAATRKVVADFQYAQNFAIATRETIYIRFQANRYDLCRLSGGALSVITHPVEKSPFTVLFGSGGDSNLSRASLAQASFASKTVLGFDSLGTPFAFDAVTLSRSNLSTVATISMSSGALTQTVNIEPYTGEITVP